MTIITIVSNNVFLLTTSQICENLDIDNDKNFLKLNKGYPSYYFA